jgi:DNA-binding Lrp family transcriptional regulator
MKLTEQQKRVIAALHFEADRPAVDVERAFGLRESTVRRVLARLLEAKLIRFYPFINTYTLGFSACSLYFSLSEKGMDRRRNLIQFLQQSPRVSWIAEMGGRYQLCVSFLARDMLEAHGFMEELSQTFPDLFAEKTVSSQIELTLLSPKYLGYPPLNRSAVSWGNTSALIKIDRVDHAILSGLIREEYRSLTQLARQLKIPISTFNLRIQQLRKRHVIVGFVYLINSAALDMQSFKLLINARSLNEKFTKELFDFAAAHPNITTFIRTVGSWDFELGVEIASASGVSSISASLRHHFPQAIHSLEIIPLLKEMKLACYPFDSGELVGKG